MPELTCVINTQNGERFLRAALESALAQRIAVSVLVIDNHSTDGSARIARSYSERNPNVQVASPSHPGTLGAVRAFSLDLVRTPFVAWLDCDDLWAPEFAGTVLEILKSSTVPMVCTDYTLIDESGRPLSLFRQKHVLSRILAFPMLAPGDSIRSAWLMWRAKSCWSAYAFRTHLLRKSGGFDPCLCFSTDFDVVGKQLSFGAALRVRRPFVYYRVHDGQETRNLSADLRLDEARVTLMRALSIAGASQILSSDADEVFHLRMRMIQKSREGKGGRYAELARAMVEKRRLSAWLLRRCIGELLERCV